MGNSNRSSSRVFNRAAAGVLRRCHVQPTGLVWELVRDLHREFPGHDASFVAFWAMDVASGRKTARQVHADALRMHVRLQAARIKGGLKAQAFIAELAADSAAKRVRVATTV